MATTNVLQPLNTTDEILFNSIWRFLALRDYVDANHNLTQWGKVLVTTIAALNGKPELEEGAVVAVELIRLGVLNWDLGMFPYNGAPMRGERESQYYSCPMNLVLTHDQRRTSNATFLFRE